MCVIDRAFERVDRQARSMSFPALLLPAVGPLLRLSASAHGWKEIGRSSVQESNRVTFRSPEPAKGSPVCPQKQSYAAHVLLQLTRDLSPQPIRERLHQ